MRVAEGIHKVDGFRIGNAYIIEIGDVLLVVDCGLPGSARHVLRTIERLGRRPDEVRFIVLTHWHVDHIGGTATLKERTGASVAIHTLDAPILAGGALPAKGRRAMGAIVRVLRVRHLAADVLLQDGDDIGGLGVIHVPGHTDGSIALRRDDVLLTGDALLADRHGRIRPPDPRLALDPATAAASAEVIRGLAPRLVLPGHGAPARP